MRNFCHSYPWFHTSVCLWRHDKVQEPSFCHQPFFMSTFLVFRSLWICFYSLQELTSLNYKTFTFIFSRWVVFSMKFCIGIASMLDEISFIMLPAQTESFTFWYFSWLFVKTVEIISIRPRLLFCISQYNNRYGLFIPLSKGAAFGSDWGRYLWLKNIGVVRRTILEPIIFREAVFMWSMPPSGGWLIPLGWLFRHFDMCVTKKYRGVGPILGVEVSSLRLITTHMMRRNHALIFFEPLFA